jgi:hypothetical protein
VRCLTGGISIAPVESELVVEHRLTKHSCHRVRGQDGLSGWYNQGEWVGQMCGRNGAVLTGRRRLNYSLVKPRKLLMKWDLE